MSNPHGGEGVSIDPLSNDNDVAMRSRRSRASAAGDPQRIDTRRISAMTISKLQGRARLALYAVVLGIGAQLAPETSMASGQTACLNACGEELRIC
jgi:hypothetical protein